MEDAKICGYRYKADQYCKECITLVLVASDEFQGWELADGIQTRTEDNLDEIAAAFGINREDEHTFDSDVFPKVIPGSMSDHPEFCGKCRRRFW